MEEKTISLESEAGFRVLFECATISILVVGSEGRIELVNPHANKIFGFEQGELTGQLLEVLLPDSMREKHEHHRQQYFSQPKTRPMGVGMELLARKKDGEVFPVEISLGHYVLDGERLAVAFITDISARVASEHSLRKANEELEARVRERTIELTEALEHQKELGEMKSRFVSFASHEFRTPLSTILSSISLVERYVVAGNEEMRKKHVERIKSSVRNLTFILNDFLSLDKLEQGNVEMQVSSFDFTELFNEIEEEMEGVLKKDQKIVYQHVGYKVIRQDKKMLRNVLLNLISNASKYSKEGKEILLNVAVEGKNVEIAVVDHGIGIPDEEQKHLFKKFFRAQNAMNIQGTGLGLNIVSRFIELMQGAIEIESRQNEGTTVKVNFPSLD